jgi:hypothetical protein
MVACRGRIVRVVTLVLVTASAGASTLAGPVKATLNGLTFELDAESGGIVALSSPEAGEMLRARPGEASLVDVAFPIDRFEPLRFTSRLARGARIEAKSGEVVIRWDTLGPTRDFHIPGKVSAVVRLRADHDGRTVVASCEVTNGMDRPIPQVLFPELRGLQPVAGPQDTEARTLWARCAPFTELVNPEADQFYVQDSSWRTLENSRWIDYGGLQGGLSLFARRWGWDPQVSFLLSLDQAARTLRLLTVHGEAIAPGRTWGSGDFVLTAHPSGWAKGIEPYRAWVESRLKRLYPLPRHIREGLGFRTVWMSKNYADDPQDAIWRFDDLPALAGEAAEHGLTEMVLWSWHEYFVLPFPPAHAHLGGPQGLTRAVAECRKRGVNLAPFVSVASVGKQSAPRYGWQVGGPESGWTYHPELIPRLRPPYASKLVCAWHDARNARYQHDVLESWKALVDSGVTSLSWDQFSTIQEEPNLYTLATQARTYAKAKDPESTFSGEEFWRHEVAGAILDYTWNWGGYADIRPYTSLFRAPRRNANVNRSAAEVKLCFADNLFINVNTAAPGLPNATARISDHPALSAALKRCSGLRRQFLADFCDGTLVGDCLLSKPAAGAHVTAYLRGDHAMLIAMNRSAPRALELVLNLAPWFGESTRGMVASRFNEDGKRVGQQVIDRPDAVLSTDPLATDELCVIEVVRPTP